MARHRNVRQLEHDDISIYDEPLASSVDDDFGISPNTASMFLFDTSKLHSCAILQPLHFSASDFPTNENDQNDLSPGLVSGRIQSKDFDSFSHSNTDHHEPQTVFGDLEVDDFITDAATRFVPQESVDFVAADPATNSVPVSDVMEELDFESLGALTGGSFSPTPACATAPKVANQSKAAIFNVLYMEKLKSQSSHYLESHKNLASVSVSSRQTFPQHFSGPDLIPRSSLGTHMHHRRLTFGHGSPKTNSLFLKAIASELFLRSHSAPLCSLLNQSDKRMLSAFRFDVPEPLTFERNMSKIVKPGKLVLPAARMKSKKIATQVQSTIQSTSQKMDIGVVARDFPEKLKITDDKQERPSTRVSSIVAAASQQPSSSPMKPVDRRPLLAEYKERRQGSQEKEIINLIVLGHVDAGKSTLMGNLLCQLGHVSGKQLAKYRWEAQKLGKASFAYAWVLDQTSEERTRGVTMDIAQTSFETKTKRIALMDAPGHKDFVPRVIGGAFQADVALLVINATTGEFETGFSGGGQTREHTRLARLLGVSRLVVVVNKMDTVDWAQDRFEDIRTQLMRFLKSLSLTEVIFCPVSGLSGVNLLPRDASANASKDVDAEGWEKLSLWYNGPSLIEIIDNLPPPERVVDDSFRFVVTDIFKPVGLGVPAVAGRVISGGVSAGVNQATSRIVCQPSGEPATVKAIRSLCASRAGSEITESDANLLDQSVKYAFAGDQVALVLQGVDPFQSLTCGDLITDPDTPVPKASRIHAKILLFAVPQPITRGSPVIFYHHCSSVPANISRLKSMSCKENKVEKTVNKPRCLLGHCTADVEITLEHPVCLEVYEKCKPLGRFMLRVGGESIAGGTVLEILPAKNNRWKAL